MRLYQHEVREFWLHHPGEKLKLMAQATVMLWQPSVVRDRGRARRGPARSARCGASAEPLYMDPALPARDRRLLVRAAPVPRARAVLRRLRDVAAWVFAGTTRYRVAWDFLLAVLAAVASSAVPVASAASRAAAVRRPFSQKVDLLGPLGAAVLGEALDRAAHPRQAAHLAPPRPGRSRAAASRRRASRRRPGRRAGRSRRRATRSSSPPIDARDHGPRALHRLERDHAEALAERRHDDDLRLLDRVLDRRDVAEEAAPPRRGRARAQDP